MDGSARSDPGDAAITDFRCCGNFVAVNKHDKIVALYEKETADMPDYIIFCRFAVTFNIVNQSII